MIIEESPTVATDEQSFQLIPVAFNMETNAADGNDSGNEGLKAMNNCESDEGTVELGSDMLDLLYFNSPRNTILMGFRTDF